MHLEMVVFRVEIDKKYIKINNIDVPYDKVPLVIVETNIPYSPLNCNE